MAVYCKGTLGTIALHEGADWAALLQILSGIDLVTTARQTKALIRRRGVPDAESLLRLALAYAVGNLSLRSTAAWAALTGVADLCDVSLLDRLRNAGPWLEQLWQTLLQQRIAETPLPGLGLTVRLIDATCISRPGSHGTDFRLHLDYRPQQACFAAALVSDAHQSEGFHHFTPAQGELFVGDRAYAKAKGLRHVLAQGGHFLVRIGWRALVLLDGQGMPFNILETLAKLPTDRVHAIPVQIGAGNKRRNAFCAARLILVPLPEGAAEKSRRKAKAKAKRQGRGILPQGAIAARWMMLLTSLPEQVASAEQVVSLYRLRWQIELAFKRLKSILNIDRLPASDPKLARGWLAANLLAALLIDRMLPQLAEILPDKVKDRPAVWRLYALTTLRLTLAILATGWRPGASPCSVIEPPRKRKLQIQALIEGLS